MGKIFARFQKALRTSQGSPRYPRKPLDEILEYLRFTKVEPYIPKGATLLDIGTGDGTLLHYLKGHIHAAVGIDPHLTHTSKIGNVSLIPGNFPQDFNENMTFDVITLLATLEHIPVDRLPLVVKACWKCLKPGGQVIITVPHPRIDRFLSLLKKLRILEGLSLHEHYGFDPKCIPKLFSRWSLVKKERWELGCNYLFIFEKPNRFICNHPERDQQTLR